MAYRTLGAPGRRTLGTVQVSAPTPAEIGAAGGTAFDPTTMTLYIANGKVAIIPALLTTMAVKLLIFGGKKASAAAKTALSRRLAKAEA